MSDSLAGSDETPTMEVRVFQDGQLVHRELCESEEQAALVVETWSELEGVECEVEDFSAHHRPEDVLAPEAGDITADEEDRTGREGSGERYARWAER